MKTLDLYARDSGKSFELDIGDEIFITLESLGPQRWLLVDGLQQDEDRPIDPGPKRTCIRTTDPSEKIITHEMKIIHLIAHRPGKLAMKFKLAYPFFLAYPVIHISVPCPAIPLLPTLCYPEPTICKFDFTVN